MDELVEELDDSDVSLTHMTTIKQDEAYWFIQKYLLKGTRSHRKFIKVTESCKCHTNINIWHLTTRMASVYLNAFLETT